ncbi:hypothetical protein IP92_02035 [Pseudoduganella flava]|uniref:Nuclear transport factor 2 family protein n=1 Tax=Pseudoduganella flava TaxID=871742 RepID=A0A562PW91_9BURK|nr:hypothetical protein [Pseudoduganella flava]QGZ39733.1 hypothetical protein GO485_12180 [Pseudoduganella flava]TWI48643.1 hypothetical protein IP92_02035 [Pseudoduganella flava]
MRKSLMLFALLGAWAAVCPSAALAQVKPADVATVDGVIAALYDTISGPAGKPRDWERLRGLFRSDGRMIVHGQNKEGVFNTRVLTVDDYIARVTPLFEKEGFFESELTRKSEQFGQIAHVFSTYESRHAQAEARPFQRGINSIQLIKDGQRWWVQSLVWQAETDRNPLPQRYLKEQ